MIIYKKALIQSNYVDEVKLISTLNPLINSETLWKSHALLLLGDFFYSKDELVFYKSIGDLAEKIRRYNTDSKKRIKIAKAGKNKYFRYFNSTIVAQYIIDKTFENRRNKFYWDKT